MWHKRILYFGNHQHNIEHRRTSFSKTLTSILPMNGFVQYITYSNIYFESVVLRSSESLFQLLSFLLLFCANIPKMQKTYICVFHLKLNKISITKKVMNYRISHKNEGKYVKNWPLTSFTSCRRRFSYQYNFIFTIFYAIRKTSRTSDRWWKGKEKTEKENCLKWLFKNRNLWWERYIL